MFKHNQVMITGGAGFIGRALVERCVNQGYDVAVIDDLCVGRHEHLAPFIENISFHEVDITDAVRIRDLMSQLQPEVVFHLAAHHFIPFCDAHPNDTLRVNVEGTHVVLSEAARQGARVAVVASTGAIYPSRDDLLSEEIVPSPGDIYGLSKAMAEHVAQYVAATSGLKCIVARLFNTYGPYETNPHLIPHILDCLKRGPRVELGNIHTKRDYIYVDDVAELLHRLALGVDGDFSAVNVGTGSEYSAEEIVRVLEEVIESPIEIHVDESRVRQVDKLHQRADTRRLELLTGTSARYSLKMGLSRLLAHEGFISRDYAKHD